MHHLYFKIFQKIVIDFKAAQSLYILGRHFRGLYKNCDHVNYFILINVGVGSLTLSRGKLNDVT